MAKAEVEPVGDPLDANVAAAEPATAAIDAVPATTNGARTASKERMPTRRERRRVRGPKLRPSYERQYRQTIRRVDLWTVLKISICFYLTGLVVLLFAGVCLWWIASAVGIVSNIENFIGDLVNSKDFEFLSWNVLRAVDARRARARVPDGRVHGARRRVLQPLRDRCSAASRSWSSKRNRSAPSVHASWIAGWG